jgi:shikimate dehydrogenase
MLLDVAYDPHPSLLGHRWSQAGGLSIGGEEMLLYQAIGQVHLMTATSRGGDPRTVSWPREGFSPTDGHEVDVVLENAMRTSLWEAM